uniref:Agrin n=1 Tax=Parascaris univalens TaxID=6257 RepID=A0A915BCP3_PARUN
DAQQIAIYGLGDTKYCRSMLYERDTKVILLREQNGLLYLNSSIISINLDVLDLIDAIIRGLSYKKRRRIKQIQCEKERCPYGSFCYPSSGQCECKTSCKETGPTVCGTDNVTYASECHLSVRSCLSTKTGKREIRLRSIGACEKRNPCEDLRCGPGEQCVVTEDGHGYLSAHCVCPRQCDDYGDSVESSPVCASDGTDFESLCHLRAHACKAKHNITVKYYGKCDPCKEFACSSGTVCKLNAERRPECRCSQQCSMNADPVCATDGNTYENECLMMVSACRSEINIQIYSKGRCAANNPCAKMRCGIGENCFIDANGHAICKCLTYCAQVMKPICAMDGKTYDNECEMRRAACLTRTRNAVRHAGTCGLGACAGFEGCQPPKVCVLRSGQPHCECGACESQLSEVCASDGITYANACKMRLESCRTGVDIYEKYAGICEGCANVRCEFYAICVSDEYGQGSCRCPSLCPDDEKNLICATDGFTYPSECHMRLAACQQQRFVVVAFRGSCDSCSKVICPYGQQCEDGLCSCPSNCPQVSSHDAVCGDDGILYASECHLQMASCHLGIPIRIVQSDHCHSVRVGDECGCNRVGAYDSSCNALGECRCKPGVGGAKCDHCVPGFWGIHLIAKGALGCRPCGCSVFGSSRLDCEQSTGRCQCKKDSFGLKCDTCSADSVITANGCMKKEEFKAPKSCAEMQCHHGAKCVIGRSGKPDCVCPSKCSFDYLGIAVNMSVCGTDGSTYDNFCELTRFACAHQLDLVAASLGICTHEEENEEIQTRRERKKETTPSLGAVCTSDKQCRVMNSICTDMNTKSIRRCECRKGFIRSADSTHCIQDEYRRQLHSWSFDGKSAIILPKLRIIHNRISIYIQIQPIQTSGVIFYAWQNDSPMKGDFVLLSLVNSKVSLSYSLGDHPMTLIWREEIVLHRQYTIEAVCSGEHSSLSVNGATPVTSVVPSESIRKHLDVDSPAYIGYIPKNFVRSSLTTVGNFSGCISNIALDGHLVIPEHLRFAGSIDECKMDVCAPNPCLNGGHCSKTHSGSRICICTPSYTGELCERQICSGKLCEKTCSDENCGRDEKGDVERAIAAFTGDGFARLRHVKIDVRKSLDVEIWLKANDADGLIFYWPKLDKNGVYMKGDFVALALIASQPHFFWNLGSGIAFVKAAVSLSNHRFHSIRFGRTLRNGTIQVDSEYINHQLSLPRNTHLDVYGADAFIGGAPDARALPAVIPELRKRFKGAIQRVSINGQIFESLFKSVAHEGQLQLYHGPPCLKGICGDGFCYARLNEYSCRCPENVSDPRCERQMNASESTEGAWFNGGAEYSYLNRATFTIKGQHSSNYSFFLRTNASEGLIWWENKGLSLRGDFMAIFLIDGRVSFAISLGNDAKLKVVTVDAPVNDNHWHKLLFLRDKRKMEMTVDDDLVSHLSSPGSTELNTDGIVWIGGRKLLPREFPYRTLYVGCIRDLRISGIRIRLRDDVISAESPPACHP